MNEQRRGKTANEEKNSTEFSIHNPYRKCLVIPDLTSHFPLMDYRDVMTDASDE
jgi:hypothetical protein